MDIKFYKDVSERTSRGQLSKAWYLIDGEPYLVKGNTPGTFNSLGKVGYEPYSEVMASRIAEVLSVPHVEYTLAESSMFPEVRAYRVRHVSVCKNFLPPGTKSLTLKRYVTSKGVDRRNDVFSYLLNSGLALHSLYSLLVFDAFTGNEDRHLNNIDLITTPDNQVVFAPVYDNGASLLSWRYPHEFPLASVPYALDRARPFARTHRTQIKLVPANFLPKISTSIVLQSVLSAISDIAVLLPRLRYQAIVSYLTWRIRYLEEVMVS